MPDRFTQVFGQKKEGLALLVMRETELWRAPSRLGSRGHHAGPPAHHFHKSVASVLDVIEGEVKALGAAVIGIVHRGSLVLGGKNIKAARSKTSPLRTAAPLSSSGLLVALCDLWRNRLRRTVGATPL